MKSVEGLPTVYLFVSRKNEAALCAEFNQIIAKSLDTFVPQEINDLVQYFNI